MYLTSLNLRGFKSFASSTTMKFEPGINAIVGPNGSGKSNVVDALAWVMGEQGAKTLRGGQMSDVIFAGTATRSPLGRAEVSLTIDNSDATLPIDYTEVTITRTLFRNGGSEYAINGNQARLLDVQELLSDTGMGKEMHVIIGQGRLDEVLTSSPEGRRGIIEEAAGVLKHRRRKEKALRKLENMKGTLQRIEDLATELRRQLGPLARQADNARKAQVIQAVERDARARLLADDIARQFARLETDSHDEARLKELQERNARGLRETQEEMDALLAGQADLEPLLARSRQSLERVASLEERFRSLQQLAAERARSLARVGEPTGTDLPEEYRRRAQRARKEEESLKARATEAQDALTQATQARRVAEENERDITVAYGRLVRQQSEHRERTARVAGKIAAATSRVEALREEKTRLGDDEKVASKRHEDASHNVAKLEEEVARHGGGETGEDVLATEHAKNTQERIHANHVVHQARKKLSQARENVASLTAVARTLEKSIEPNDANAWARKRATGSVKDFIDVERGWEAAAENALAGLAGGVVVENIDDGIEMLRQAASQKTGRLAAWVLNGVARESTKDSSQDHSAFLDSVARRALSRFSQNENNVAVCATDVISGKNGADFTGKLAGTVLCHSLEVARELVECGALRVVTSHGDVLTQHDVSGGQATAQSVLATQRAYTDALENQRHAQTEVEECEESLRQAEEALQDARSREDVTGAKLKERDSALAAITAQLGAARDSVRSAQADMDRIAQRSQHVEGQLISHSEELETLRQQHEELAAQPALWEADLTKLESRREPARTAARQAREAETQARLAVRTAEERLRSVVGKADSLDRRARSEEERLEREVRSAKRASKAREEALKVEERARQALNLAHRLREALTQERTDAETEMGILKAQQNTIQVRIAELTKEERELADSTHRRELMLAELKVRLEQLETTAKAELGMNARTIVEEYGPLVPVPTDTEGETVPYVRKEQEERLAKAQRQLARLGKINPLALEEHAALEERHNYVSGQLEDMKKSRRDLLEIVRELDAKVTQVMESAIRDVSRQFGKVFERLFPGGHGKLVMTEPDSVLTTGIEIEARPPGKKVKRLSLLSGGERSLTAIAFLVSIFMARPSPFYVLDEVEAALDDVNLSRLLDIFKDLQQSAQLLVITHQQRTMEIADVLYGVSMREKGVTSVISQKMSDLA
ncbi:chromosome segregation protein SMC [Actinotignum urinale]|uniref:chromosome segregation protein SMC n=1 Tax=Actinotignum urinale TaxID=190146 RepID=UPI002A8051B7|nr:chromosome segregation protein SMC [Actinotignum urinale]MDY5151498.1 chromosome segregation protein SMC [Actinotignum urinale]